MRDAAKALVWYENMPNFEICWNRRRFQWRWRNPENAPLFIEAILLELFCSTADLNLKSEPTKPLRVICSGVRQEANSVSCADRLHATLAS